MNHSKLENLIALIDDPDEAVFNMILEEILKNDISVVDHLEHIWETSLDELVQKRIEYIIQQIQLKDTKEKIRNWANQQSIDLFEGFFLISRHQNPELKLKPIEFQLEKIRKDVWLEFRNSLTSLEKITILNHIFYDHYRFTVDTIYPESPQHCLINHVLESRKGNSISITILYTLVARSLNLPVHYLDFQNIPLVGYFDKDIARLAHGSETKNGILFYINPSNKGAIIGPKEVDYIHQNNGLSDREKLTSPCTDRLVIKRLIEKLAYSYNQLGVDNKADYLNEIADIL